MIVTSVIVDKGRTMNMCSLCGTNVSSEQIRSHPRILDFQAGVKEQKRKRLRKSIYGIIECEKTNKKLFFSK